MNKDKINKFIKYSLIRAIKTFCQTILATIPTSALIVSDVNWGVVISASLLAAFLSLVTSVAFGIPEADISEVVFDDYSGND